MASDERPIAAGLSPGPGLWQLVAAGVWRLDRTGVIIDARTGQIDLARPGDLIEVDGVGVPFLEIATGGRDGWARYGPDNPDLDPQTIVGYGRRRVR